MGVMAALLFDATLLAKRQAPQEGRIDRSYAA
jgi:hypothetical protein